jgi:hypothetical protein
MTHLPILLFVLTLAILGTMSVVNHLRDQHLQDQQWQKQQRIERERLEQERRNEQALENARTLQRQIEEQPGTEEQPKVEKRQKWSRHFEPMASPPAPSLPRASDVMRPWTNAPRRAASSGAPPEVNQGARRKPPVAATANALRPVMQAGISTVFLGCALVIVMSHAYDPQEKHWAYGTLGTILGFWLKGTR